MNRDGWFIVGAIIGAIMLTSQLKKTRGMRNNNPGNIRQTSIKWLGEEDYSTPGVTDDDPSFEEFDTMEYGIRALGRLLRNYQRLYGLETIHQIINRYAPPPGS